MSLIKFYKAIRLRKQTLRALFCDIINVDSLRHYMPTWTHNYKRWASLLEYFRRLGFYLLGSKYKADTTNCLYPIDLCKPHG